jgi:vacuole morphology and inheritance protein 14
MVNVLELFSTDRRLLETRGSLIIRQLCLHLNAERIFRTIAEILEKDDVSQFYVVGIGADEVGFGIC